MFVLGDGLLKSGYLGCWSGSFHLCWWGYFWIGAIAVTANKEQDEEEGGIRYAHF